jgi:hypothetical protein
MDDLQLDPVGGGVAGRTGVTLKISVQRDYNTFLYGALPLCVILAHEISPWFLERYVQVYSYYCSEYEWPELDMCDAFAYPEVLDTVTLDRESLAAADIIQLIRTAINDGFYATVFLDTNNLVGDASPVFVHECLAYGYDDTARSLLIVGFAADLRFTAQRVDYDIFRTAFDRALVASEPGGKFSFLGSLVQLLTPRSEAYQFSPKKLAAQLRGYQDCTPVVPSAMMTANAYWWLRDQSIWSLGITDRRKELRFGLAVYDDLEAYLSRIACGTQRPVAVDYRVFHLWFEHKRSILRRLSFVANLADDSAELRSLSAGWRKLVRDADVTRLGILHHVMARRLGFPAHTETVLREIRTAEADLLAGICDQLDTVT